MKATKRRAIKFNLGNYEMYEVEAGLEYDTDDWTDDDADMRLDEMMSNDVNRGQLATSYKDEDNQTSVYTFNQMMGGADA